MTSIGGFIPLDPAFDGDGPARLPDCFLPTDTVSWTWTHNGRIALNRIVDTIKPRRIFFPAFICRDPVDAVRQRGSEIQFYPVGQTLRPDLSILSTMIGRGDAVLGVDFFGFPPCEDFLSLRNSRPDVFWIQDLCHAGGPTEIPWGDALIYSFRKIIGVPDGGLLVSRSDQLTFNPIEMQDPPAERSGPWRARAADPDNSRSGDWFPLYRSIEETMPKEEVWGPSTGSVRVVASTDWTRASRTRRSNFRILQEGLSGRIVFRCCTPAPSAPMAFPILAPTDAGELQRRLAAKGVFAARHWGHLPSPQGFAEEHLIAQRILSLPVDQRYGRDDMLKMIKIIEDSIR
jgi:hypothetical protein